MSSAPAGARDADARSIAKKLEIKERVVVGKLSLFKAFEIYQP